MSNSNIPSVSERVTAGMAFLDEHFPGHNETVDLNNLDISSEAWCPLAQASGDYYSVAAHYLYNRKEIDLRGLDDTDTPLSQRLGFMAMDSWSPEDTDALDNAWIAAYQVRKAMWHS